MEDDWNRIAWNRFQTVIASLNIVIRNLMEQGNTYNNSLAMAKTWRVYVQSRAVDVFGPTPFASYKEIEDNPPYKSVEENYKEFFEELEEANALYDINSPNGIFEDSSYDIIFNGDISQWQKFANSLRLRLALRISEVNPEECKKQATAAITNGVMTSWDDRAVMPPKSSGGWAEDYNYTMFQVSWGESHNMSLSFEKLVTNLGGLDFPTDIVNKTPTVSGGTAIPLSNVHPDKVDPRGPIMFQPAFNTGDWKGIPFGCKVDEANSGNFVGKDYADMGILIKDGALNKTRPYDVMLFEEVCFLKAEAALRGFAPGDAKAEYENGIHASFETWGVGGLADEYLTSTDKNYAGTSVKFEDQNGAGNTALEKIITQKYIASYPDMSMEAWSDKRRLNLPRMDVGLYRDESYFNNNDTNIKDPKNFIKRIVYPNQESAVNKENYDKGVQLLGGGDNVATPLWWDKNSNYCTSEQ